MFTMLGVSEGDMYVGVRLDGCLFDLLCIFNHRCIIIDRKVSGVLA